MASLNGLLGTAIRRLFAVPAVDPPMRWEVGGTLGWRTNRLSDVPAGLEIVGSACGYLLSLFCVAVGAVLLLDPSKRTEQTGVPWAVAYVMIGLAFLAISSLSTGQLVHRARLRRRLLAVGLAAKATVIDRWTIALGRGTMSAIRFRFMATTGPVEGVAADATKLVSRVNIGDQISLRYDPADPRRLIVDALPRG